MSAPIPSRPPPEAPEPPAAPAPPRHCPACGGGHYRAVRFCPFCGTAQAGPAEPRGSGEPREPDGAGDVFLLAAAGPASTRAPDPPPASVPPASAVPPSLEPAPDPFTESLPPPRRFGARRSRPALVAAGLVAAGLAAATVLGRGPRMPEPARIGVGPAWTAVALGPMRAAPRLRLTADAAFSLRLDGERVQRVGAGGSTVVDPRALRGLELRAARGRATVLLTPAE